jgi:ABC-type lipoprotein export system ATPase subunit
MATHDRELASRVSRVLRIEDGRIVEDVQLASAAEGRALVAEMDA